MILGIGCDIVEVIRFSNWIEYPDEKLLRLFTICELADGRARYKNARLAEFFSSRFAAKEAFYKALCASIATLGKTPDLSFESVRSSVSVLTAEWGGPTLAINWDHFALDPQLSAMLRTARTHLSLAHEKHFAIAHVIIEHERDVQSPVRSYIKKRV